MTLTERASFDTLFHNFTFNFPSNAHALRYMRNFSGDVIVQNQAIHELTHFYFSVSPVTRALRALRNKALFTLLNDIDRASHDNNAVSNQERFRAVHQWRIAEAVTQCLLPIYEGTALMAEFDCCLVPCPSLSDQMTFMEVQREQCEAAIRRGALTHRGFHQGVGHPNVEEALILDATAERLGSDEIHTRKTTLLNLPLFYVSPEECYLVAWLFAREAHLHISRAIDSNVSPLFVIKYLRSYFLEDWELVAKLLDIFYWRHQDTGPIIQHLQGRLEKFSRKFTRREYDAYRQGVVNVHREGHHNFEFLPGLLRGINVEECHALSLDLQRASFNDFAPEAKDSVGQQIFSALIGLQNRQGYIAIHQGEYAAQVKSHQLHLTSDNETLLMNVNVNVRMAQQTCLVAFHLSGAGGTLQRIARVYTREGTLTAWIGGDEPNLYAALGGILEAFEHSEASHAYVEPRLGILNKTFQKEFGSAIEEGCLTARAIFLTWLGGRGGFYAQLRFLSERLGKRMPPRDTFVGLFRDFLSKEDFSLLIRHSLVYGIGYNIGEIARGKAREAMPQGGRFAAEIDAIYKIMAATGISDFNFFYQEDAPPEYALPRYYF